MTPADVPAPACHRAPPTSGRRPACLVLLVVLVGLAAGCARHDAASDGDRRGVFYGGVSGGLTP